ncbi:MAG: hypothetical protein GOV15_02130 [Candidatus Diapherotrites archaeon]|nr:hypothetical protein [Candidatus Diapherotrites archaeon]
MPFTDKIKKVLHRKKEVDEADSSDKEMKVLQVLEDLLKMEDVLACMVAKKGLEGGLAPPGLKIKDLSLWRLVDNTTDQMFEIVKTFYDYGLDRVYLEIGRYTIIMATLSEVFALIVIIPSLANRGLIDVEVENSKRQIEEIIHSA